MTREEAREMVIGMIASETIHHKDKERTHYVADWTRGMMTGKGHDKIKALKPAHKDKDGNKTEESLLTIYRPRETEIEKDQLIRLYNPFTTVPAQRIGSTFDKPRRTDGIEEVLEVADESKHDKVKADLADFYGGCSLREWSFDASNALAFTDPNSFVAFEHELIQSPGGAAVGVNTYPVIFKSSHTANFEYKSGKLYWFLGEHTRTEEHEGDIVELSTFWYYQKGFGYRFREVYAPNAALDPGEEIETIQIEDSTDVKYFAVMFRDMRTTKIPVAPIGGAYSDPETDSATRIGPLSFAENQFHDIIRDKSLLDVLHVLHAYPQKYVYAPECNWEDPELGRCDNGDWYDHDGNNKGHCPKCKGWGASIHTTPQDIVVLKFRQPGEGETLVPLTDLVNYVNLPLDVVQYIQEALDRSVRWVQKAILGTTVVSQDEIQIDQTATARLLDVDAAQNRVDPHVQMVRRVYACAVQACADYWETELIRGAMQVPTDYNIEGISDLIAKYSAAKQAQMSQRVLDAVQSQVLQKLYRNDPVQLKKMNAYLKHQPFRDKSPEVIAMIIGNRSESDYSRVLYENWSMIQTKADVQTDGRFHQMTYEAQEEVLKQIVAELVTEIQYNRPEPVPLLGVGIDEPDDDNQN